jgi:PAS domain S-box-containing protein
MKNTKKQRNEQKLCIYQPAQRFPGVHHRPHYVAGFNAGGHYSVIKIFNGVVIVRRLIIYYNCPDTVPEYQSRESASHPHPIKIGYSFTFPSLRVQAMDECKPDESGSGATTMNRAFSGWYPTKKRGDRGQLLSVLYVDDDPALLSIGKTYLERQSDISVATACCVKDALTILKTFSFDVILSDYQMPITDGIEFLKILQDTGCTIPFILFTGKGREEVVIEAINNGATYYIQKGGSPKAQFAELEHKIREASRRRRAEAALREIELHYRTLFEFSGTAIMTFDADMAISSVNTEFSRLTGYAKDEIEGIFRWTDIIDSDDREKLLTHYANLIGGSVPQNSRLEFRLLTKDQRTIRFLASVAIIPTTGRSIVSLIDTAALIHPENAVGKKHEDLVRIPNIA